MLIITFNDRLYMLSTGLYPSSDGHSLQGCWLFAAKNLISYSRLWWTGVCAMDLTITSFKYYKYRREGAQPPREDNPFMTIAGCVTICEYILDFSHSFYLTGLATMIECFIVK